MRKDLKRAAEHIDVAINHMQKVIEYENTPEIIKKKVSKIIEVLEIDKSELLSLKESQIL